MAWREKDAHWMKRFFVVLLGLGLVTGCESRPGAADSPSPVAAEETPGAPAVPQPAPSPQIEPLRTQEVVGVWEAKDSEGDIFNLQLFPGHQAVSNWAKGAAEAKGERGFWRIQGQHVLVFFDDGWTDLLGQSTDGSWAHAGYAPGTPLNGEPSNQSAARKLTEAEAEYVGVWRLNKEPDGRYLYVALQSDGQAFSNINTGTKGTWTASPDGALCQWPDGWTDQIRKEASGYIKHSWPPGASSQTTPAPEDMSEATKAGAGGFIITP